MTHEPLSRHRVRRLHDFATGVEAGERKATAAQVVQRAVWPLLQEACYQQARAESAMEGWRMAGERVESQERVISDLRMRILELETELSNPSSCKTTPGSRRTSESSLKRFRTYFGRWVLWS